MPPSRQLDLLHNPHNRHMQRKGNVHVDVSVEHAPREHRGEKAMGFLLANVCFRFPSVEEYLTNCGLQS